MSGLLGVIPQRHFTVRAEWWLRHCTVIMPREYPKEIPVGLASCVQYRATALHRDEVERLSRELSPMTATAVGILERADAHTDEAYWWSMAKHIMEQDGLDTRCIRGWSCGAQDIRAHYINMMTTTTTQPGHQTTGGGNGVHVPFAIHAEPTGHPPRYAAGQYGPATFTYTIREAMMPTCQECIVLMAQAWEAHLPKHGKYPTKVTNKHTLSGWKEL